MRRSIAEADLRAEIGPVIHVPQVALVDFDDTIVRSRDSVAFFNTAVADMGLDPCLLEEAATKQSPLAHVRQVLEATGQLDELLQRYGVGQPSLMQPDVQPFFNRLLAGGVPKAVMTYGEDFMWQCLKLTASRYLGAILLTSEPNKGLSTNAFRWEEGFAFRGVYDVPPPIYVTESLCLIDDKASSFAAWDGPGFCIWRTDPKPKQQGALPDNVRLIHSLDELTVENGHVVHVSDAQHRSSVSNIGSMVLPWAVDAEPILNRDAPETAHSRTVVLY